MKATRTPFQSVGVLALAIFCAGVFSAAAQIKVTCVGDSITAGYGLSNPGTQSYPAQLQVLLGSGYTVENDGASGSTVLKVSDNSFWSSPYSGWAYTNSMNSNPDVVVMMFGANDSKSWNWNAANFNSDYRELISQYQNLPTHPKVFACYTPPMFLPTAFGTTFDPVFIENTVEPAIATTVTQAGVQLIDNDTPLLNRPDLFQDGVHPTPAGAAIVAQTVYNAIKGLAPTNITSAGITSSGTPSVYGSPVTYTAMVTSSAGTVTGAVVFAANNVPFSTNALSGGTASVTNSLVPVGANVVAAQYVSQGKFLGNTHSLQQIVTDTNGPTLSNLGGTAPVPGPNDIAQLSTSGDQTWPDGLNYFTDNGAPAGQTFTTPAKALNLVSVAIKTAGFNNGNGYGTPSSTPTLYLRIYSISGTNATLLNTFSAPNPGYTDGAWLRWSNISMTLSASQTYAYSFGSKPDAGGWAALSVASANTYAGGEIALIPISGGGVTTGGSHNFDATFVLGLQAATTNNISASTPLPLPTYGFNLGNSLEAVWGYTYPTAAALNTAAASGFNAVRIPVAWAANSTTNVSGGVTNYPINPVFMGKVKQTVDNAIAAGLYVVMNDHWDDGWLENNIGSTVDPVINAKMNSYWAQIATTFAGYDNHLLFAAANEPNVYNTDEMKTLMYYYQTFVNAVRATGGNNTNRWLVIQSVSDPTWMNALPTDTVSNRIMVEYHNYTPSLFTIIHSDQSWGNAIYFWGAAYHYSGNPSRNATWGEEGDADSFYHQLNDLYVSKGIPVMIGEFGAYTTSLTGADATWNRDSALYWDKYLAESARVHGISPFYWSTPGSPIDFTSGAVNDAPVVTALTGGTVPPPPNGAPYAPSDLTATGGNGQVALSWTAGGGATSYNLYRATQSGGESSIAPVVTGITGTSYTDTSLSGGTTYYYQVVAVNGSGLSGFSPETHATTSGTTDLAQFNFETSSQGWSGGGGIVSGVATSASQQFAGNQSLAVNFNGGSSGTGSPSVGNVSIVPGTTITFHVWIPSGSKVTALQPYIQDHINTWSSSWYGSFTADAWNTLTLTVPTNAATPLNALGIQFFTSAGWTGSCYIDSVSFDTAAPDFDLSANPTSLTVNGGTNDTSAITITPTDGLNACYTLSVSNLPGGLSATFTNNPNTGGASLLMLTASNSAVSVTTNVTVIATAGLISHTENIALTVNGIAQPNTSPTLEPIADQTVNVGQTVVFTASATDTDQPSQTLTFALAGSTNATLNTNSGAFSFRPVVTQAGATNDFTLTVSDNGTPSLSATQSFAVVVNPLSAPTVSNISVAGGQFNLSISGQSGPDYAVETSTNLTQWSTVFVTNSPALPFTWTDTNSAVPQRFFRVKLGPPLP